MKKNSSREIIKKYAKNYELKLELAILDRYLSKTFGTHWTELNEVIHENNPEFFEDDENLNSLDGSIPAFVYGDPEQRVNDDAYYVSFYDLKFPFDRIFSELYLRKNPTYQFNNINIDTGQNNSVVFFKDENVDEVYVFFHSEVFQILYSYYDSVFYEGIDPEGLSQEHLDFYTKHNFIGDDIVKSIIAITANDHRLKKIKIVIIPSNIKTERHKYLQVSSNEFNRTLKGVLRSFGIKEELDLEYVDYFELLEREFEKNTVNFLISRYTHIYDEYHKFFVEDFMGNLAENYKEELIEELKITSNFLYKTKYPINTEETISYKVKTLTENTNYSPTWSNYRFLDEIIEFNKNFTEQKENYKLLEDETVYRMLITSEWLYSEIDKRNYFDNSSVCVGYLKSIEYILFKLVSKNFNIRKNMTVGSLINFIEKNNTKNDITLLESNVIKKLKNWNRNIRNGFFHKDIMNKDEVEEVREKTFVLIFELLNSNL